MLNAVQPSVGVRGLSQCLSVRCWTRCCPALCHWSLSTTAGGCCARPAPWEHPRQTPTRAGQSHSRQTHAVALPRVCRVLLQPGRPGAPPGHPRGAADRSPAPERGAALGETEAGGSGGASGQPRDGPPKSRRGGAGLNFSEWGRPACHCRAARRVSAASSGGRRSPVRPAPVPVPPPMAAGRRAPPEPGGGPVLLQGIFGAGPTPGGAACSLALTARELQVRRPGGSSGGSAGPDAALRLADCVGSSAFPSAAAACFSLVCYPLRGPRWGSPARQRLERTFRVSLGPDAEDNLRIAQAWSRRIRELSVPAVPTQDGQYRSRRPQRPPPRSPGEGLSRLRCVSRRSEPRERAGGVVAGPGPAATRGLSAACPPRDGCPRPRGAAGTEPGALRGGRAPRHRSGPEGIDGGDPPSL